MNGSVVIQGVMYLISVWITAVMIFRTAALSHLWYCSIVYMGDILYQCSCLIQQQLKFPSTSLLWTIKLSGQWKSRMRLTAWRILFAISLKCGAFYERILKLEVKMILLPHAVRSTCVTWDRAVLLSPTAWHSCINKRSVQLSAKLPALPSVSGLSLATVR